MFCRVEAAARLVDVGELHGVADAELAASGSSSPAIMRKSVVLPAPFGPITPDDAAGRQRERHVLDEQPVAEPLRDVLGLDDDVAEARPGGMWISTRSSLTFASSASSFS